MQTLLFYTQATESVLSLYSKSLPSVPYFETVIFSAAASCLMGMFRRIRTEGGKEASRNDVMFSIIR